MSHELKAITGIFVPSGSLIQGTLASGMVTSGAMGNAVVLSGSIASGQITSSHITSGGILGSNVASGTILGANIAATTVANDNLVNKSITIAGSQTDLGTSWAASALTTSSGLLAGTYYPSGSLTIGIASGGVVAQMIGSGAVTSGAIASGQIGINHFASGLFSEIIGSGSVSSGNLGIGAVNNLNIASGTISNDKLVNSAITIDGSTTPLGGSYNSQALTTSSGLLAGTYYPSGILTIGIASGGVVAQMMASGSVLNNAVASGQIDANKLAVASGIVQGAQLTYNSDTSSLTWAYPTTVTAKVKNGTASIISGLAVVYISGGQGGNPFVAPALANADATSLSTFGVATANIGANSEGQVITQGTLTNVNTSAFSDGAVLFLSPTVPGGVTTTKPQAPQHLVLIGYVLNAANNGSIEVAIQNGYELDELHDVRILSGSLQSGQVLQWSSGVWWNQNFVAGSSNIGSGAVTSGAIASGSIGVNALASGLINGLIGSGSVGSGDLGLGAVNNENIASGTVANDKLTNSSVTIAGSSTALGGSWTAAALTTSSGLLAGTYYPSGALTVGIASGGITSQMLADASVNTNDIASGAVGTNQIASGAVTGTNIAATTVANTNLVNSTVTIAGSSTALGASWAAAALTTSSGLLAGTYYPSGALTIGIASGGIIAQMIGSGAITSGAIASGQVGSNALASGVIAGLIVSGSVGSGDLGLGAVNNENIASGTVANDKLANSTVTIAGSSTALGGSWVAQSLVHASGLSAVTYYPSGSAVVGIASGGIVAQMMGSGSVTTNAIASGSVTANALASGAVSDIVGSGSVTSGDLGIGAVNNINVASGTLSNDKLVNSTITIAGSSTALGGSWAAQSLTAASGLSAVTYYPSGAAVIGIASGGVVSGMLGNASVVSGSIGSGQIGQFHLASGATSLLLTSGIIVSGMVGNNTINSGNIASGSIGQFHQSQLLIPKMQAPGRLSLYSGAPIVSGGYISGASKVYYNPYNGSTISLFDGVSWLEYEVSNPIALDLSGGFQSGLMYDIFMFGNAGISGSVGLSSQSWTSGANRPPIIYKNGIPISQFGNGRYVGTIRTTTSSTTEDSKFRRFVWNYDNRIQQSLYYTDSTQHTYNTETPRVWNLNSGSRLEFIQGVAGIGASASCFVASYVTPGATSVNSFESEGVFSGTNYNVYNTFTGLFWSNSVLMVGNCNVGYNYLQLMESCQSGTVTNVSMTLTGLIEG